MVYWLHDFFASTAINRMSMIGYVLYWLYYVVVHYTLLNSLYWSQQCVKAISMHVMQLNSSACVQSPHPNYAAEAIQIIHTNLSLSLSHERIKMAGKYCRAYNLHGFICLYIFPSCIFTIGKYQIIHRIKVRYVSRTGDCLTINEQTNYNWLNAIAARLVIYLSKKFTHIYIIALHFREEPNNNNVSYMMKYWASQCWSKYYLLVIYCDFIKFKALF